MKSYQQRMETSGIADRIALLAHDHLVQMYEGMGYDTKGKSDVRFGGGGWNDLVRRFDFLSGLFKLTYPRRMIFQTMSRGLEDCD